MITCACLAFYFWVVSTIIAVIATLVASMTGLPVAECVTATVVVVSLALLVLGAVGALKGLPFPNRADAGIDIVVFMFFFILLCLLVGGISWALTPIFPGALVITSYSISIAIGGLAVIMLGGLSLIR